MKASSIDSCPGNSSLGSERLDESSSEITDHDSSSKSSMLADEDDEYSLASSYDEEVAN